MAKQRHDIGVQKRLWREENIVPWSRNRVKKERIKRAWPGPLPENTHELNARELKEVLYGDGLSESLEKRSR